MWKAMRPTILSLVLLLSVCSAQAITITESTNPDLEVPNPKEIYLREWNALGPFPIETAEDGKAVPESWSKDHLAVKSIKRLHGDCAGLRWSKLQTGEEVRVDLASQFSPNESVAVYLGTYVFAPGPTERNLLVGSDDGITVWLNGERIHDKQLSRACEPDQDSVPVSLERGSNLLLIRVTQGARGWEFAARFDDNSGLSTSTLPFRARATRLQNLDELTYPNPRLLAGPYVQNVSATSGVLMWYTDVPSRARVTVTDGKSTEMHATASARRVSELIVGNLEPDSRYSYSVEILSSEGTAVRKVEGTDYVLSTFPVELRPISFIAYGDTRSEPERHASVIAGMANETADFVIHTGDLVAYGPDLYRWPKEFFGPAGKLMSRVPFFAQLGNHEADSQYYFDLLSLPMGERYYSFDVLDAHFIGLDSCTDFDEGSEQYDWLIADLEKHKDARWKFVFMHHPTYSSSGHASLGADGLPKERPIRIAQKLLPRLADTYGINAVFAGHDHTYERSTRDEVRYIVTGGGGAPTYGMADEKQNPYREIFHSEIHYCLVTLDGQKGKVVVKKPNGRVLDEFDL